MTILKNGEVSEFGETYQTVLRMVINELEPCPVRLEINL